MKHDKRCTVFRALALITAAALCFAAPAVARKLRVASDSPALQEAQGVADTLDSALDFEVRLAEGEDIVAPRDRSVPRITQFAKFTIDNNLLKPFILRLTFENGGALALPDDDTRPRRERGNRGGQDDRRGSRSRQTADGGNRGGKGERDMGGNRGGGKGGNDHDRKGERGRPSADGGGSRDMGEGNNRGKRSPDRNRHGGERGDRQIRGHGRVGEDGRTRSIGMIDMELRYKNPSEIRMKKKLDDAVSGSNGYVYELQFLMEDVQREYNFELWGRVSKEAAQALPGVYQENLKVEVIEIPMLVEEKVTAESDSTAEDGLPKRKRFQKRPARRR